MKSEPFATALLVGLLSATPALAAPPAPLAGDHAAMRLVASGAEADGPLLAAIEIRLDPGWKTYWRSPGEAGFPPMFDFSASSNVASAEIAFPPPVRDDDGFAITNVYKHDIVLPVVVRLTDPKKPARLALTAEIGVCEKICIPVRLEASLKVEPGQRDKEALRLIEAARAKLPGLPVRDVFAARSVKRIGGSDKTPEFEARVVVPAPAGTELFVEGPAGWYVGAPSITATDGPELTFRFNAERSKSAAPVAGTELRLTVTSGGRAIEQRVVLE